MNTKLFGLAAAAAVSLALLTGCPAEEKKETGTTGETTTATGAASPDAMATGEGTATTSTTTTTTTTTTTEHASPDAHGGTMAASPAGHGTTAASPAAGTTTTAAANVDAKAIFSQKCSGCHGANGGGGMGPALTAVEAKGDAHIKKLITNGSPEKGMPAFGQQLNAGEVDALIAYVKSL